MGQNQEAWGRSDSTGRVWVRLRAFGFIDRLKRKLDRKKRWVADLRREAAARDQEAARREAALKSEIERIAKRNAALEIRLSALEGQPAGTEAVFAAVGAAANEHDRQIALLEQVVSSGLGLLSPDEAVASEQPGAPIVSVIMPVCNRSRLLREAIHSVRGQVFPMWELIVVDDGSTDSIDSVIEEFADDPRIHWLRQPRRGASAARNAGLRRASGELIAYLDSDNVWYPRFLSEMVAALDAAPEIDLAYGVLATSAHGLGDRRFLFKPFDREELLRGNFIDINVVVHRRTLVAELGGFDESLDRLVDWDLLLRYSENRPALCVGVLGARYRTLDNLRISDTAPYGPNAVAIQKKWYPPRHLRTSLRILYVVWHYPQLSETYIETEIRRLLDWGVHIEVWRETDVAAPHPPSAPVHSGSLEEAVRMSRPDLIHMHWLNFALKQGELLSTLGLPVTVRLHGFDTTREGLAALLSKPWLRRIYAFPAQAALLDHPDPGVRVVPAAFDTTLFRPRRDKDCRLVVRAGTALPSKDIALFFGLAKALPDFRFVYAGITAKNLEAYVDELIETRDRMQAPVEIHWNVPRAEIADLIGRAGIYLHTINPPDAPHAAPLGMPVSIAEAMATGALVVYRRSPEFDDYVGEAGRSYSDLDEAARIIAETESWSAKDWMLAQDRAIERAYRRHPDEIVYRTILEDWAEIVQES